MGLLGFFLAMAMGAVVESAPADRAADVEDPVFAYLLGVIDQDRFEVVSGAFLDSVATGSGGSRLPVELIESLSRTQGPTERFDTVRLDFFDEVKTPIPYSILKYNPGSIRASKHLRLDHYRLGDIEVRLPDDDGVATPRNFESVELLALREGRMKMDIDGWLDKLMRGKLDDVELSGFLVFRDGNGRIGLGFGYTGGHKGRTGAFDFTANETIFPAPKSYLALGRAARELAERLAEDPASAVVLEPYRRQP